MTTFAIAAGGFLEASYCCGELITEKAPAQRRRMMPTRTSLSTSVTTRDPKGRKAVEKFEAAYNKTGLDEEAAQRLNESRAFVIYLAEGIRSFSREIPTELRAIFEKGPLLEPAQGMPARLLRVEFEWRNRRGLAVVKERPAIEPEAVSALYGFTLQRAANDPFITEDLLKAVGESYQVTHAHIAAALETQWTGEPGPLTIDGHSNLFYAEERVFHVSRYNGYWIIGEAQESVRDPWPPGTRVFAPW